MLNFYGIFFRRFVDPVHVLLWHVSFKKEVIMFGTHDLMLFVVSGFLLNITPGADSLYIATRSTSLGIKAGIIAAVGISVGCLFHVLAAALGLSAILATSSLAFSIVKWLGAAYLIFLGLSFFWQKEKSQSKTTTVSTVSTSLPAVFMQGFLTNVLNPKVALFFLAFVPQFIDSTAQNKPMAFIFLGVIFTLNSALWCLSLAWFAARMSTISVAQRTVQWLKRGVGTLFVFLGIRLAVTD